MDQPGSSRRLLLGWTGATGGGASGLDYYGARSYDPVLGQFASADTVADGLNRYGYVHGNPTTFTDPSGHMSKTRCFADDGCFNTSGGDTPPPPTTPPSSDGTGGQAKTEPQSGCHGRREQCRAIDARFHNQDIRDALYCLLGTQIGEELLTFILLIAGKVGEGYIDWVNLPHGENAYTDFYGFIQLSGAIAGDVKMTANAIVHEAVESYYAIVFGIRTQASQRMDYVAQWFAGEFQKQKETYEASNNGHFGAYDLTFSEWQHTPDFGGYKDQPPSQWEADLFGGIAPGFAGPNFVYVGLAAIAPDLNLAYFELRDPGVLA